MLKLTNVICIFALIAALLGSAITATPVHAASRLYVNVTAIGNGDCSSWADACTLQTAIASSSSGDEIWVQAGVYTPDASVRTLSFTLKSGVSVYGGFNGTETPSQFNRRDPAANLTVLSGDLNGDDDGFTNNAENSYHVVKASNVNNNTVLDGFTIRGGNANSTSPDNAGGGMFVHTSTAQLTNLIFSNNSATEGGAIYSEDNSDLTLDHVTFDGNAASTIGGGMRNYNSSPILTNVTFSKNSAGTIGGGMSNVLGAPQLTNASFSENTSANGGALFNASSNAVLTDVTLTGNTADSSAGAIYNYTSNATLTNVTFTNNSAGSGGGGMLNYASDPTLVNVTFTSNTTGVAGGGIYNYLSDPALTEVTFTSNSSSSWGGAMYNYTSNPTLTKVTFTSNSAPYAGGMGNVVNSTASVTDSVFNSNTSTVNGGGVNNVDSNPTFTGVTFSGNSSSNTGGGMFSTGGSPVLTGVTFTDNSSPQGGGMMNWGNSKPKITNATFNNNTASANGGAINNTNSSPALTNVTISANSASNAGGGMYTVNGSPTLQNVTFSGNSATVSGGGLYYSVSNIILANVIAADSLSGGDCVSVATLTSSVTNNLLEDAANACGMTNGINKNIVGFDPLLAPLSDNGGSTPTQALSAGSLAVDTGDDASCPATDQRGVARPGGNHCDIGAYESDAASFVTITGNAGAEGVTLTYTDGTTKTVTSQADGSYTITVGSGWTGTITPTLQCYNFTPATTFYPFLLFDQTGQDYGITLDSADGCSDINVNIGEEDKGTYLFLPQSNPSILLKRFDGMNNGPVIIRNVGNTPILASERVGYQNRQNIWTSFSEMMGFPLNLAGSRYTFPWYNNININTQLRFANVGNTMTTITVKIGGVVWGTYTLAPNQSLRQQYQVNSGPVVIESIDGGKIIASERVAYKTGAVFTSFSEMMGLPDSQLSTAYMFPWYNNINLNSQLRFANMGTSTTVVTVTIDGELKGAYTLAPNESTRQAYSVDAGPVVIQSSGNVPIIASLRVGYTPDRGLTWPDLSEMIGFPAVALDTTYYFPWYNDRELNTQLRFANAGNTTTTVTVTIGGVVRGTYTLAPNQSVRQSYQDLVDGPVVIQSSGGVKIIASERVGYFNGTDWTSFSETMGLPANQLTNAYVFPWYNNVNLNTQLRFGVP